MNNLNKIALGGGCHWCTEAVFQSLLGVANVEQGFVASNLENKSFSEAVIVHYNQNDIALETIIHIHLLTHKSTKNHSFRKKYRSAIYYYSTEQKTEIQSLLNKLQNEFEELIITKNLAFIEFKHSDEAFTNYYVKNPEKPFCKTYINPKLNLLLSKFSTQVDKSKLKHLK
ncbi:peptide-methionine (S)-S-oxide reductase [Flavobacteriaceae bacterium]|nr:peptide-methionine (S)-S-oxide reductase [Flavobacteriaceae bacterium]